MQEENQTTEERSLFRLFLAVLGALSLIRVLIAAGIPLLHAECYYWLWSQRLSFGYFDHPPMIAYLIRLFTAVGGDSPLCVRLGPVVLAIAGSLIIYSWTAELYGARSAFLVSLCFMLSPMIMAFSVVATPDVPLIFFWILASYSFYRAVTIGKPCWWYLCGFSTGLCLMSKLNGFLLYPCFLVFLLWDRRARSWLARKELWIAVLVSFVVDMPNLLWNATHHWETFTYLVTERPHAGGFSVVKTGKYLGCLLGLLSPVLGVYVLWMLIRNLLCAEARADRRCVFLLSMSIPVLIWFGLWSPFTSIAIHWPATALICAIILAVGSGTWESGPRCRLILARGRLFAAALVTLAALDLPFVLGLPALKWVYPVFSPTRDFEEATGLLARAYRELNGWDGLGLSVTERLGKLGGATSQPPFVLTKFHRLLPRIEFMAGRPIPFTVTESSSVKRLRPWIDENLLRGRNGLFVDVEDKLPRDVADMFQRCEREPPLVVQKNGRVLRRIYFFKCIGFRGRS